jgi:hypothetical protein
MIQWLSLSAQRRKQIIDQISFTNNFSPAAIEKDWYVTLALQAVVQTPWASDIVFKGGTSLSKAWNLITRFSEDVDLAISPTALGFTQEKFTKGDVKRLRRKSAQFMGGEFLEALTTQLRGIGVGEDQLTIQAREIMDSDMDPRIIELEYPTLYPIQQNYVRSKVLLEVGARSLRDPYTMRPINSLISDHYPDSEFSGRSFEIATVNPDRTFLEKLFLLHEEFTKPAGRGRFERP